ncbi:DUF1488 family protein [Alishewanella sp. d11]|uniref:DUF1488 family protein n=1 Tax=Alishewanella sp. d11 TaxID=3414030 RepID=UPI003BF8EE6F
MNQQLIFNNDFYYAKDKAAIGFSCLVAGLKVTCFIPLIITDDPEQALSQVKAEAFTWEDKAELAISKDSYNEFGEIWL